MPVGRQDQDVSSSGVATAGLAQKASPASTAVPRRCHLPGPVGDGNIQALARDGLPGTASTGLVGPMPSSAAASCNKAFGEEQRWRLTERISAGAALAWKPAEHGAGGGEGIRTLDKALGPYNGLANRRLQPLGHPSAGAVRVSPLAGAGQCIAARAGTLSACSPSHGAIGSRGATGSGVGTGRA